jgi:hypothetical protein
VEAASVDFFGVGVDFSVRGESGFLGVGAGFRDNDEGTAFGIEDFLADTTGGVLSGVDTILWSADISPVLFFSGARSIDARVSDPIGTASGACGFRSSSAVDCGATGGGSCTASPAPGIS